MFVAVAVVLCVVVVKKSKPAPERVAARFKIVVPAADDEGGVAVPARNGDFDDFGETSFIALENDETLLGVVTNDFDGDGYEDQVNIVKTSSSPYLVLIVGLYNPRSGLYERSATLATNITQFKTFACAGIDVTGNHKNMLVYQGAAESGHSVLRIFNGARSEDGKFVLELIGDFDSDGSVFIQQIERNEAYELSQAKGTSFPVWVYSSAQDAQDGSSAQDQVQTMYDWNESQGKYIKVRSMKIAQSRIAAEELARIQDGTVATFAKFLDGLWYKTENSGEGIRYIFFDYTNSEVIFQYQDSEEVYSWLESNVRGGSIYFSSVNKSIANLQRRFDIAPVSLDEIRMRVQDDVRMIIGESNLWDGNYKKMSPKSAAASSSFKTMSPSALCVSVLVKGPAWQTSDGSCFVFKDNAFSAEDSEERPLSQGRFAVNTISSADVIQFKTDSGHAVLNGWYLPAFASITKTVQDRRGNPVTQTEDDRDTLILQSVAVSPDGFFRTEDESIVLRKTELKIKESPEDLQADQPSPELQMSIER